MNTKKGISLIVLVITIIVVIILAAAVILTLNKNNPIDSARIAQLVDSRDSLNSSVLMYVSSVMTKSQGALSTKEIITAKSDSNQDLINSVLGTDPKSLIDPNGRKDTTSNLYKISADCSTQLGVNIPTIAGADWYINVETSQFYLIFTTDFPSWMSKDGTTLDNTTLQTFVEKK